MIKTLYLGGEVAQPAVTEAFQGSVSDQSAQEVHVGDKAVQVRN